MLQRTPDLPIEANAASETVFRSMKKLAKFVVIPAPPCERKEVESAKMPCPVGSGKNAQWSPSANRVGFAVMYVYALPSQVEVPSVEADEVVPVPILVLPTNLGKE
jgi:hypothetical protein